MKMICHGCGGLVGRDCFNPQECERITRSLADNAQSIEHDNYQLSGRIEHLDKVNSELLEALKAISNLPRYRDGLSPIMNDGLYHGVMSAIVIAEQAIKKATE